LETRTTLKAAVAARAAVARLDQVALSMPHPAILLNTLPLLEAQASSQIENVVTTTDLLFRHVNDDRGADPATKETLRYQSALTLGEKLTRSRGLGWPVAQALCSAIRGVSMDVRSLPGTRVANPVTGSVIYSPPEGRDVIMDKVREWEAFVHADDDLDPLIRMAASHYQFEAIHPFTDGNGRTGRLLNVLLLVDLGLLHHPLLHLSGYFMDSRDDYYRLLLKVTADEAWEEWITYVLNGVTLVAEGTLARISRIRALQEQVAEQSRSALRLGGANALLQALIFEEPYVRIQAVVERCQVSRPTATSWLEALAAGGVLRDSKVGRDRYFVNDQLLSLLRRPSL
jgi:Fic family protein